MQSEVERFKYTYRVCIKKQNGGFEEDMKHKIICGWIKWKNALSILCDKRIQLAQKIFYKTVARSTMLYMNQNVGQYRQENRTNNECYKDRNVKVVGLSGVTGIDKVRNEYTGSTRVVAPVVDVM